MSNEEKSNEATKGGANKTVSKQGFYAAISEYTQEAIDHMVDTMRTSRNESLKFAAARAIIDKTIPDLKSVEIGGELDEHGKREPATFYLYASGGFIPTNITLPTTSSGSTGNTSVQQPTTVQSADLAPESEKDIHSNNGDIKAGSS